MSKNDKYVLYGAGALALVWFYSKSRAVAGLVFAPGNISSLYIANGQPVAELTVLVQNTNSTSLEIQSFAGTVFSNGQYVGNVYNFQRVVVPGNSMVAVPVIIQMQVSGLVNEIISAFQYGNISRRITVTGNVNVEGAQLPIRIDYNIGG